MKKIHAIFNTILPVKSLASAILVFTLLYLVLPGLRASAAQPTSRAAELQSPSSTPVATAAPTLAPAPVCDASRSVQVNGTAVINVTPDRALIQLGVQSNGSTPGAVELVNSTAMQAVINAVRLLGVETKDIATDVYIIEPVYENYDSMYIKGYRINNMIAITVRDISKTSPLIAAALQAGANQVVNVNLYTSQLRKYRDQARELAMQAASEKAQALAKAAGAETGCILTISENTWSAYNGWFYGTGSGSTQNLMTQNVMQNSAPPSGASAGSAEEPISLGQISVRAEINASFGLK